MHGLTNHAIQRFVSDNYGLSKWVECAQTADLGFVDFESMLMYPDQVTYDILKAACRVLDRPRVDLMEDIGTYLVSHSNTEALRRLLRFGGVTFVEFLHSLDDLPGRTHLAVPDLDMPEIELLDHSQSQFSLVCKSPLEGFGHVMMGVLRAMADDYGVLAVLEYAGSGQGVETISINLIMTEFWEGRSFELGARVE